MNFDQMDTMGSPRYPFLTAGDYTLEVVSVSKGQNFKDKKNYFRVTANVLTSSGTEALAPNTTVTIKIDEDTQYQYHLKDIRNLVAAIADEPETKVGKSVVEQLLAEDNPGAGQRFQARRGRFADKGRVFMATRFAGPSSQLPNLATPEEVIAAETPAPRASKRK